MVTKLSEFDKNNTAEVIEDTNNSNWFSARLLRYLDDAIWSMDNENFAIFWHFYEEHCRAIFRLHGWTEEEIREKENQIGIYAVFTE